MFIQEMLLQKVMVVPKEDTFIENNSVTFATPEDFRDHLIQYWYNEVTNLLANTTIHHMW